MYNEKLEKALKKYEDVEKFKKLKDGEKDILQLYYKSREKSNLSKKLVIDEIVWDYDFEDFINALKKYEVNELVFSSTWSSSVNLLMALVENGYEVVGTEIYYKDIIWYNKKEDIRKGLTLIKK